MALNKPCLILGDIVNSNWGIGQNNKNVFCVMVIAFQYRHKGLISCSSSNIEPLLQNNVYFVLAFLV